MAAIARTRYARTADGAHLAFQIIGTGPPDVLLVFEWLSHQELRWEEPQFARFLRRLAANCRVVTFDKRGCGMSDPAPLDGLPPLEEWAEDVSAVLESAGVERCAVMAVGAGGPTALVYAAAHPERVSSLVLVNTTACYARKPDYPIGLPASLQDTVRQVERRDPGAAHPFAEAMFGKKFAQDTALVERWDRYSRLASSPGPKIAANEFILNTDVRSVLDAISAPTLVLHRSDDRWTLADNGRYIAEHIKDARLRLLTGDEHAAHVGDIEALVGEVEEFVTGSRHLSAPDRVLATVLFTDIVRSTESAAAQGDRQWRYVLDAHHAVVAREIDRNRGQLIKTTGDGVLATFDGPGRGIRCAQAIRDAVRSLGLEIRAGLHTGEVDLMGSDVGGIAVHIAARVMAEAGPDRVLVSGSVPPLVAGSGLSFTSRGHRDLKGVPGRWELFEVDD